MPRYTKRHYEDIAAIIANNSEEDGYLNKAALVSNLAVLFRQDNPNFNWDRFVEACK